jgi:uncharacterized protein (TIGR01777 family)
MKILVSGSGGLVGSALLPVLRSAGHQVTRLVRRPSAPLGPEDSTVQWDPETGEIDSSRLEGIEAAVHLAGENIAARRWTPAQKARIRDSRVQGTARLSQRLANLTQPPATLVAASAIGYYGNCGERLLLEESRAGQDFLARVCADWEAAAADAAERGIRVVSTRLGMVLSSSGGALGQMLPPFRLGVGGVLGSGSQYMSWVALDDVVGAIAHVLTTDSLHGPVNVVAPEAVRNREFTKTLGRVLRRPTRLGVPSFAARLMFGEMADALLLASTRVEPAKLQASGYSFRYPQLEGALRHVLGKLLADPQAHAAEAQS